MAFPSGAQRARGDIGRSRPRLDHNVRRSKSTVGRLATVVTRIAEHETPGLFLARHFCKSRWDAAPLNRPEGFELHAHKSYKLPSGLKINSWVRNRTVQIVAPDQSERAAVSVEQDLNTLAEEANSSAFDERGIRSFFELAIPEFDAILKLYYPPNGT
ncbi:MAG: hypothetical protein L0216_15200 [Planctomycetales bacterium]|nr:hypothetical protein [Planctomycetales bacterium]